MERIVELYKKNRELTLLEWTYLGITIVSFVVAGLLALLNQPLGVALLVIPLVSFVAFVMNIMVWALIKLIIEALHPELKKGEKANGKSGK